MICLIKNNSIKILALFIMLGFFASCTSMDEGYEEFISNGEISYTGKLDSLKFFSGNNRIKVEGLFMSDPKITECRVFWNSGADSISVPVIKTDKVDTLRVFIENMPENIYSFKVYTYDKLGNKSIPVTGISQSYGERYKETLTNRVISSSVLSTDLDLTINFASMDLSSGVFGTEIVYTDINDVNKTEFVSIDSEEVVLEDYKEGSKYNYRTMFLPDETAIDTFHTDYVQLLPDFVDFTNKLTNVSQPFQASSFSGRWGILAGWTTNTAAKNHGGYGGWDSNDTGVFNVESGWGAASIVNGKVYQTITLEPGNYTFKAEPKANGGVIASGYTTADNVYLTAAEGSTLPDSQAGAIETDPATLGYTRLVNTMAPDDVEVSFTVTQTTDVSLGLSTTQGQERFLVIYSFSLLKNNN
ncbi:DUF4998 domain-containing protein [Wenyingzhuangia sp. chi5]|uniref:DUF4998 domain-containing protein n=1 Tax=Wenyingzhuangia gilva TaxID=3057677 RepID=A0ABT8VR42_9FLAO|nr:DUF4998 domain-containing protein [Wenyingzhuangia sp. chi5]MDO3694440.1 DUF4998 domain-containing protein [Wenyingzhuangia sp. chi5]